MNAEVVVAIEAAVGAFDPVQLFIFDRVALLRREAATYPDDPQLIALVGELSVQDPQFRQWWAAHHVGGQRTGTKTLHHPVVGDLTPDWDTLTCSTDPDQQLVTWSAEPGTPSHDGMRILASWAAEHRQSSQDTTT